MLQFAASKCPTEEMSLTNRVFVHSRDYQDAIKYCAVHTGVGSYTFRTDPSDKVPSGKMAFGLAQRKWANLSLDQPIRVEPIRIGSNGYLGTAHFGVEVFGKKAAPRDPINADEMAKDFSQQFSDTPVTVGQSMLFRFNKLLLTVEVKQLSTPHWLPWLGIWQARARTFSIICFTGRLQRYPGCYWSGKCGGGGGSQSASRAP
ncbi:unnamed protein product [Dibothriocephalus latus]|uniref:Vesicle-fusing ATPase n=1 Tax=Dibothriocephalus latus TaxID=60516 RepID=A0A3P7LKL4_DIBLA|nr:unnamed protein product [Dibothriocephalus latus]